MNNFDKLNDWIRGTETSIVNFLSAFAPWLAPATPAYMTFQHAYSTLNFPFLVALSTGVVVEILGFSAVSTFLSFWFHNRKNVAESKKAPLSVVVIAFAFYLALIVTSNVLLDSFPTDRWAEIAVRALFTLQTIPAALLVAVRTQHRELLTKIALEKASKNEKVTSNLPESSSKNEKVTSKLLAISWKNLRPKLSDSQVNYLATHEPKEIVEQMEKAGYKVTPRSASNWRQYAMDELGIK